MWIFLVIVTGAAGALAGFYAWTVFQKLLENQIGHPRVKELSNIIHGGAMAFLKKQRTSTTGFMNSVCPEKTFEILRQGISAQDFTACMSKQKAGTIVDDVKTVMHPL